MTFTSPKQSPATANPLLRSTFYCQLSLKEQKMNIKQLNSQVNVLTLFFLSFTNFMVKMKKSVPKALRSLGGGWVNLCKSVAKKMKNKPNLKMTIFALIPDFVMTYKAFFSKNPKGNEPKRSQLNPIKPNFSAELFSDTRLRQGAPGSVQVYVEDCSAAVQRSSRKKKPLKSPRGEIKIWGAKPISEIQYRP